MILPTISASKIKTFRTCARKYQYTYLGKNRPDQDKNVGALNGSALHKAIELHYGEGTDAVQTFTQYMNKGIAEWEQDQETIRGAEWFSKNMKEGRSILKSFNWDAFNPIQLELRFDLPFPDVMNPFARVNGVIDLIDTQGYIVDHKSQAKLPDKTTRDNDAQFILYVWAYEQLYGVKPIRVIWNHLRTGMMYDIDVLTGYEDKLAQLTSDMQALLNANHFQRINYDPKTCKRECSFFSHCFVESAVEE